MLADLDEMLFAQKVCRLWQLGPAAVVEFLDRYCARTLNRTQLEHALDEFLGQEAAAIAAIDRRRLQ
jgi:hypothetical protein